MSGWIEIAVQLIGATVDGLIGLGSRRDHAQKNEGQAEKKLQELIERNKQFEAEINDRHT